MRKLKVREVESPTGSLTYTEPDTFQLRGAQVATFAVPSDLSPLSDREPAAPREQLYQRVQHTRQLHVQQWTVHPGRLAV